MQIKHRIVISHKEYSGSYINKGASGLTTDLDQAITFKDIEEASKWFLTGLYSPPDKDSYRYARIEVTKREIGDDDYAN